MSELVFTLRDTSGQFSDYQLLYKIRDNSLGKLWKKCLNKNFLENNHPIEKTYCLQGWQTTWESNYPRNLTYLCNLLNSHISTINSFMPTIGYPVINLNFTLEGLQSNSQEELLNKIHHHFEILIGQAWDPSEWWLRDDIPSKVRFSIRMLNNLCHEIEGIISSIKHNITPGIFGSLNGINSNGRHFANKLFEELNLENYKDFSDIVPFGCLILYYAQLGKQHKEVFDDNDTDIERKNISGIRYVTGEWTSVFSKTYRPLENKKYIKWLKKNDWNVHDPRLALKTGVVADLITDESKQTIVNEILKRDDLYKIELDSNQKLYNYTWKDEEQWQEKLK